LSLHERGQALDVTLYDEASKTLDDDYEDVRMVAIKLIWVFSHICPERYSQNNVDYYMDNSVLPETKTLVFAIFSLVKI
jgi:hypothetical protein